MRVLVVLAALAGCASGPSGAGNYGENAYQAYIDALDEFYDDDCFEAEPLLRNVRRQFPYSRYAALSELRVADCNMREGKYAEAIEAYNQFVRYRPSHPEVPYARFQAALANFEQIPSEWLLSPPTHERDQYSPQESLRLFRRFMLDFPEDPLLPRARELGQRALTLLAAHELYVATFYFDRGHPRAAAGRLNTLLRNYPGSGLEAEALNLLGQSYLEIGEPASARRAFAELLARYPSDDLADEARDRLSSLGG